MADTIQTNQQGNQQHNWNPNLFDEGAIQKDLFQGLEVIIILAHLLFPILGRQN
jgi:hypothetical protein